MKSHEFITEVSQNWEERRTALFKLRAIYAQVFDEKKKLDPTQLPTLQQQAKAALNICGRAFGKTWDNFSPGYMYDKIVQKSNELAHKAGTLTLPTSAPSLKGFAQQIATYFSALGARYNQRYGRVWSCSNGTKHKDPEHFIQFKEKEDADTAWEELSKKGKRVYITDALSPKFPHEYLQFGKVLISRYNSDDFAVQSAAIVKNEYYHVHDITDQQAAALQDIAATKNANAIAGIKAIMAVLQGEQDVKKVLANSAKITQQDKAKLDAIIAGAANFKEQ